MHAALKLDNEIWKEIPSYPGTLASNLGRIKTSKRYRKFYKNPKGYFLVCMSFKGKCRTEYVHHLIADAFLEKNDESKKTINHKNGIKTDNRVENMERCTYSENLKHAYDTGLKKGMNGSLKKRLNESRTTLC